MEGSSTPSAPRSSADLWREAADEVRRAFHMKNSGARLDARLEARADEFWAEFADLAACLKSPDSFWRLCSVHLQRDVNPITETRIVGSGFNGSGPATLDMPIQREKFVLSDVVIPTELARIAIADADELADTNLDECLADVFAEIRARTLREYAVSPGYAEDHFLNGGGHGIQGLSSSIDGSRRQIEQLEKKIEADEGRNVDLEATRTQLQHAKKQLENHEQALTELQALADGPEVPLPDQRAFRIRATAACVSAVEGARALRGILAGTVAQRPAEAGKHRSEPLVEFVEARRWVRGTVEIARPVAARTKAWFRAWNFWSRFFGEDPDALVHAVAARLLR